MNAVQHLAMNCRDRLAQEAFYIEHFGFTRVRTFNRGKPGEFVMARLGSMCLEFFGSSNPDAGGGEQAVGFKHLAFEVPDLEAAIAKLQAAGIQTDPIHDASASVPGLRICFFRDPEGNILELMQGWQDE
jgi:glyoxylase I family protein